MALTRARKDQPTSDTPTTGTAADPSPGALAATRVQTQPRRRPMLLAASAGLIATGGLASLFVVNELQTQNQVVQIAQDVHRGEQITAADLTSTTVGSLAGVSSVPAARMSELIGQYAAIDLKRGGLLPNSAITADSLPDAGQTIVGLSLAPGRIPIGTITPGTPLRLVITPAAQPAAAAQGTDVDSGQIFPAVMVSTSQDTIKGTGTFINVQVASTDAPTIGLMSAANRVVVLQDSDR